MTALLEKMSELISVTPWLAPIAALVSGVLTSFMPCSLSTIPLVIGYVGGAAKTGEKPDSRRAFLLSLLFALGSTVVFCVLGLIASLIGELLEESEFIMHNRNKVFTNHGTKQVHFRLF